jgi:GntR family transcriptional regulator
MWGLFVDEASSLPPWVQIKHQLKLAYTLGRLRPGDVLPSIRTLAKDLGVGDAVVRRAYRELTEVGFLVTEKRKGVMVAESLVPSAEASRLAEEASEECLRLLSWARERGLSSISLARLLLRTSRFEESARPSYIYVDETLASAARFADTISHAWEIHVGAAAFRDLPGLGAALERATGIVVSHYREDRMRELVGERAIRIFPVRVQLKGRFVRRLRRVAAGTRVLLVFPDADFGRGSLYMTHYLERVVGKLDFEPVSMSAAGDLVALAKESDRELIVVSYHLWDELPETARRNPKIIPTETEIDMASLEAMRNRAGVIA